MSFEQMLSPTSTNVELKTKDGQIDSTEAIVYAKTLIRPTEFCSARVETQESRGTGMYSKT